MIVQKATAGEIRDALALVNEHFNNTIKLTNAKTLGKKSFSFEVVRQSIAATLPIYSAFIAAMFEVTPNVEIKLSWTEAYAR